MARDAMKGKFPSQQITELLNGDIAWDDAPASIRSWARLFIHEVAKSVLDLPREKRRGAIDKAPSQFRPMIEDEIIRLWELSKAER